MSKPKGVAHRRSLLATQDLKRLGINALDQLLETRKLAMEAFKNHRGYSDKSDAGVGYLGLVLRADLELIALQYAKLSAIAIKDLRDDDDSRQRMSTAEAIEVLKKDPFAPQDVKSIDTKQVLDAMESQIKTPFLPSGNDVES